MATIYVGSARIDENGNTTGGAAGDQTGKEVMIQAYYMHSKGWYCFRPKTVAHANAIAQAMSDACANDNIGYDQGQRLTVIEQWKIYKTIKAIATKCEGDCSSVVRLCILQATGIDVGDFTTESEPTKLKNSGIFEEKFAVTSSSQLYNGDVLVTKTKGHTVVVTSGRARSSGSSSSSSSGNSSSTSSTLTVDGQMGTLTTKRAQTVFGTTVDGTIDNQLKQYKSICAGILTAEWSSTKKGGSELVKSLQKKVGVTQDGYIGPATIKAWQKWMGTTVDGKISNPSLCIKAFQKWLNTQ